MHIFDQDLHRSEASFWSMRRNLLAWSSRSNKQVLSMKKMLSSKQQQTETEEAVVSSTSKKSSRKTTRHHHHHHNKVVNLSMSFEPWWNKEKIDAGVAAGKVVLGTFHQLSNKRDVGFVKLSNAGGVPGSDVFIEGVQNRNRAMRGDLVAAEITGYVKKDERRMVKNRELGNDFQLAQPDLMKETEDGLWAPTEQVMHRKAPDEEKEPLEKMRRGKIVSVLIPNSDNIMSESREEIS